MGSITCAVHGDIEAENVACPDCMREARALLSRALAELREHVPGSKIVEEIEQALF